MASTTRAGSHCVRSDWNGASCARVRVRVRAIEAVLRAGHLLMGGHADATVLGISVMAGVRGSAGSPRIGCGCQQTTREHIRSVHSVSTAHARSVLFGIDQTVSGFGAFRTFGGSRSMLVSRRKRWSVSLLEEPLGVCRRRLSCAASRGEAG
eukprot:1194343-Prorocentrum_minimum.AAC.4